MEVLKAGWEHIESTVLMLRQKDLYHSIFFFK